MVVFPTILYYNNNMSKTKKKKTLWGVTYADPEHKTPVALFRNIKRDVYGLDEGQIIYWFGKRKSCTPTKYNLPRNKDLYIIVNAHGNRVEDFMEEYPEYFF